MARYTLILGTKDWSSWSLRPYVALRATGAEFEEIVVRLRREDSPERLRAFSPSTKVPVLKIEENGQTTTVWDSLAICETLAERHPDAKLWPDNALTRAVARSYAAEMHSGFAAIRNQLSMDFVRRLQTPDLDDTAKSDIARIIAAWSEVLEKHGGDFLFGRFSIADAMYAPVVSRFTTYGIDVPPVVKRYIDTMFALPAMRDWAAASQKEVDAGEA
ncbi:MAG TPA: glutathione S-transferase family protein [Rhizomicrobium sp.]